MSKASNAAKQRRQHRNGKKQRRKRQRYHMRNVQLLAAIESANVFKPERFVELLNRASMLLGQTTIVPMHAPSPPPPPPTYDVTIEEGEIAR